MIVVTSDHVEGKRVVKTLGMVKGNTIRAKHIGKDIVAGLRNIVGGEIKEYTEMMAESREQAISRMMEDAEKIGANGVINVRFSTSMVMGGAAELLAYGTAVKLE
ncbi:MAG: YbjQ family protein [Candidatus Aenigmatarchaeota archaeon]|nr:MAG: YbjQ family protein [Candidatus Aenigmarchaeota archaeon]